MNILSIESSSLVGSVAVHTEGALRKSWAFQCPRGRGGDMFFALEAALAEIGRADLVVVGTGPGGYNGLRMSVAAAWGIARAHGARFVGVTSLLGYKVPEYYVVGDARAGQWFLARISGGKLLEGPVLMKPEEVKLESGIPIFCPGGLLPGLPEAIDEPPQAEVLALRTDSFGEPVPIYLKPAHITKPARPFSKIRL